MYNFDLKWVNEDPVTISQVLVNVSDQSLDFQFNDLKWIKIGLWKGLCFRLVKNIAKYGNAGCQVVKRGIQNWNDFLIKINIPKENCWILRIGLTLKHGGGAMARRHRVPIWRVCRQFSSKLLKTFLVEAVWYQLSPNFFGEVEDDRNRP